MAGYDVAAELHALLESGDLEGAEADGSGSSPLKDVRMWSMSARGLDVVDVDDEDFDDDLVSNSREIENALQEHLEALENIKWAD
jgi:hypothetical protein